MDPIQYATGALLATLNAHLQDKLDALDLTRDASLLRIATPAVQIFDRPLIRTDADVTTPVVTIERKQLRPGQRFATGERLVTVRLGCFFPGPTGDESNAVEAVSALAAAVNEVVQDGDGRGSYMVGGASYDQLTVCRPRAVEAQVGVRTLPTRAGTFPFGIAYPEFEIQVWV